MKEIFKVKYFLMKTFVLNAINTFFLYLTIDLNQTKISKNENHKLKLTTNLHQNLILCVKLQLDHTMHKRHHKNFKLFD